LKQEKLKMPTGYTVAVQEGRITNLREFAMHCARAMTACIAMRDEPFDAKIPDAFEPYTKYHDEEIAKAQETISEIPKLTEEECSQRAAVEYEKALASYAERIREKTLHKDRYEAMLGKVQEWQTNAEGIKEFMLKQLKSSIDFDCDDYLERNPPVYKNGEQWRQDQLQKASQSLAYHTAGKEKEIVRTKGRNRWLKDLRDSLQD
jgi:hypothetical protein